MAQGRATYVTYNDGLQAKHLHLGNLVHDYRNPNSLDPYVETAYADISEPAPPWARLIPLENYALTLGESSREDDDAEDLALDSADEGGADQRYRVVASEKTTKLEIKDPKKFFTEVTLKSTKAKQWLSSRLSAAESLALHQEKPRPQPQIWLLTGLILMTHTTWTSLSSKDQSFIAGLQAPFDPTGVSAIRRLSVSKGVRPTFGLTVSDDVKNVAGTVIHETGKYPGTRGWAAQWQRVDVKILQANKGHNGSSHQLKLKHTSGPSPKIAAVELGDVNPKNDSQKDKIAEDLDDEYWDAFLEASEQEV